MTANVCPGYRWEVAKVRNSKEETRTLVSTGPCSLLQVRVRAYPFSFVACGYWEHNDMALKHGFVLKTTLTACVIILMRYPEHLCTVSLWLKQAKDTRDSFSASPTCRGPAASLVLSQPRLGTAGISKVPFPQLSCSLFLVGGEEPWGSQEPTYPYLPMSYTFFVAESLSLSTGQPTSTGHSLLGWAQPTCEKYKFCPVQHYYFRVMNSHGDWIL